MDERHNYVLLDGYISSKKKHIELYGMKKKTKSTTIINQVLANLVNLFN